MMFDDAVDWDADPSSSYVGDDANNEQKVVADGSKWQRTLEGVEPKGFGRGRDSFNRGQKGYFRPELNGHTSRECKDGFRSAPKKKGCYNCNMVDHLFRDCPTYSSSRSFGNRFADYDDGHGHPHQGNKASIFIDSRGTCSQRCFKCGEEGHMSRNCPNRIVSQGVNRPSLYVPPPPPEDEETIFTSMQTGINFSNYDFIPTEVTGVDPPPCIDNFDEANLPETIKTNVNKAKYTKPTPVQKNSIPIINAGRDLMACAQTGSGKTAAFLLPVLSGIFRKGLRSALAYSERQTPQAIIVGPTRELVFQIFLEARKFARNTIIKPVVAYGGTSVASQLRDLSRGCNILIATPGRLLDFINRGRVGCEHLEYLILDEADRMLDMGFEGDIRRLASAPNMLEKHQRQTLMFSATFPDEIQKLAHDFLKEDFLFLTVGRVGSACSDVTQTVLQVDGEDKRETLMQLIVDVAETKARTLVFVDTKRNADFLATFLSQEGLPTTSIHGDRLQREREMALRDFKSGQCPIMVATSVAARGLDIPKVEHVINYDLPSEIDEYVHRIGRTGRCGNLGMATSFYCSDKDNALARSLVKILADAQQEVPDWLESCAEGAIGTSFGPKGGQFGARDTRNHGHWRGFTVGGQVKGDLDCDDDADSVPVYVQAKEFENSRKDGWDDEDDDWE